MTDLWQLSATALAGLIRGREISAEEAAVSALDRLAAVNPRINAVIDLRPEEVLAEARAVDARLARGEDPGPMAGVPVTIKVTIDQAGHATTNGLRAQKDLIAKTNSPVVDLFRAAGAVALGRTNTPAFSYRWFTTNLLHGDTYNPHDRSITPGGSSGGASAAVASGIGAIGQGTDIAGSIRYPAYACGVHGLRPSFGRCAQFNASGAERLVGAQIMAVSGPIARTIPDLRLALEALSARDLRDPWWVPAPLAGPEVPRRVALCYRPDGLDTAPEVIAALDDAAARLRDAGWEVEPVEALPPLREAARLQVRLWMGDNYAGQLAAAEAEGDPGALAALRGQRAAVEGLTLGDFSAALARRATLVRDWAAFLERWPVLLLPVSGQLPFPWNNDLRDAESYAATWEAQMPQVGLPFMGVPALSVATGKVGTVPVGVQLVAARFREDLVLAAGEDIAARGEEIQPVDPV